MEVSDLYITTHLGPRETVRSMNENNTKMATRFLTFG